MSDGTLQTLDITMLDDVGTGASQLIQLDSNAKIPACSGAAITGLSAVTKNASDPAIDTNPSGGVGSVWQNTTSGEMFICTDATAGENVWTNIGAGSGDVIPAKWYGPRGAWGGGIIASEARQDVIDYITIATTGNATDFGNILIAKRFLGGASGGGRGLFFGGGEPPQNVIQYITMSTPGNATDFGDLTTTMENCGGLSDGYRGVRIGGAAQTTLDYVTIATTGNAIDFGDATSGNAGAGGLSNGTYGLYCGGDYPNTNIIDKITVATTGNAVDWADLLNTPNRVTSYSNDTRGIWAGGFEQTAQSSRSNVIQYVTIATQANAIDFGDLLAAWVQASGVTDAIKGCAGGGKRAGGNPGITNVIDYVTIATTGNSVDFGDLTVVRYGAGNASG